MKSVVIRRPGEASVEEMPVPRPGDGEIVVAMKYCGLCGTDMEKIRGEYTAAMPVLGHEPSGVVSEVGKGVKGLDEGDRVFVHHHVPCGECHHCRNGSETMCDRYRTSNIDPGGFSEYFRVPGWNVNRGGVLKLPDSVGDEEASLIEPVACCMRAIGRCGAREGDVALVVGAGPLGLMHAKLLSLGGVRVLVSDINDRRLGAARSFGAEETVDAAAAPGAARRMSEGRGADIAITASGSPAAILQAIRSVRKGGRVCLFGVPVKGSRLDYDMSDAFSSELSIFTNYGATERETVRALSMMADGRLRLGPMISHRFPLTEFGRAVEASASGEAMKVLLHPDR
ncbi:MAG: alcohol dehydrogenase catalytic domain-containing protein [Nitrososphaerota archaeon]|nr:alcohol dehydrogenase catalytic domain-containing protein [Nitrososphaerota archaeon]MDG6939906.1 alcohol dehydrogenase catalytic domain-containing protein [Nitrososphaerota archaeon]